MTIMATRDILLVEDNPADAALAPAAVERDAHEGRRVAGRGEAGPALQLARFDGLAGCLRTPAGGSSRQILLFVDGDKIRSRLRKRLRKRVAP